NLASEDYTVTILDENGCITTTDFTITDPENDEELEASVEEEDIIHNCFVGGSNGSAEVTVSGGYAPYQYSIDGGNNYQEENIFTDLLSGDYTVTILDENNCTVTADFTITDPEDDEELTASVEEEDIVHNCFVNG